MAATPTSSAPDTSHIAKDATPYTDEDGAVEEPSTNITEAPSDERTEFLPQDSSSSPHYASRRQLSILGWFIVLATATGLGLILAIGLIVFEAGSSSPRHHPLKPVVILASFAKQNVTWISELPDNWQAHRMCNDCGNAPSDDEYGTRYPVPTKNGREVAAYLTYIINNYHNLPPYMVFLHGHDHAWHQPERSVDLLRAINFTAVEEEGYVSFTCTVTDCNSIQNHTLSNGPMEYDESTKLSKLFKMTPAFWAWAFGNVFHGEVPEMFNANSGGQFAVSATTVRRRPLEHYIGIRRPLLGDMDDFDALLRDISIEGWGLPPNTTRETIFGDQKVGLWAVGTLFEGSWHHIFAKNAFSCPRPKFCRDVFLSGAIDCPVYHKEVPRFPRKGRKASECTTDEEALDRVRMENDALLGFT